MCALIESPAVKRITMLTRRQVDDLLSCPGALGKAQADGKVDPLPTRDCAAVELSVNIKLAAGCPESY
jgi:hypothetical protein